MRTAPFLPDAERLARDFARVLSGWLTPDERHKVIELNRLEANGQICHTHDFCDPNQAMIDAFEALAGRDLDLQSDLDNGQIDRAWSIARKAAFWFPESK